MNNFYCAAPWRGLHINPRGDVKTCCAGNPNMLGNLNSQPIEQILDGPVMKEIRQSIRQGKIHQYCSNCVDRESKGGESERTWHNKINEDFDIAGSGDLFEYATLLDIRWNNTCNLSCNYCGNYDSSKWAALKQLPLINDTRKYFNQVCDFIEKNYQHVKEVALVGGEPLLLPENERLLDVIPNNVLITIITNLNNKLENNKIFQKLAQRRRVGWSISFDNIGAKFEYVRHGAEWSLQEHNLSLVRQLIKDQGHWGGIHAVYNLYNATNLVELKKYAQHIGMEIRWQNLHMPAALDTRLYGQEVAELAAVEIQNMFYTCQTTPEEKTFFSAALEHYQSRTGPSIDMFVLLKKFVNQIETYHPDQQGKFHQLWPEISRFI
jgi:MoaA/NifB/PqqE/SkfB family radical SAM enzyme